MFYWYTHISYIILLLSWRKASSTVFFLVDNTRNRKKKTKRPAWTEDTGSELRMSHKWRHISYIWSEISLFCGWVFTPFTVKFTFTGSGSWTQSFLSGFHFFVFKEKVFLDVVREHSCFKVLWIKHARLSFQQKKFNLERKGCFIYILP